MRLVSVGKAALKIYTCHILVFTAGCVAGAVEAFTILAVLWGPK
jgi:hypothetical protein